MTTTTIQIALDAIHGNVPSIPVAPPPFAVGGYINGAITAFQWTQADWARFPASYHIRINVTGELNRGNALDVETGDATPGNVQPWLESRAHAADPLLVYCNRSNLTACLAGRNAALAATGVYAFMWCATLDGTLSGRSMTQLSQVRAGGAAVADLSVIQNPRLLAAMAAVVGAAGQ
jgi:hypothetical protein